MSENKPNIKCEPEQNATGKNRHKNQCHSTSNLAALGEGVKNINGFSSHVNIYNDLQIVLNIWLGFPGAERRRIHALVRSICDDFPSQAGCHGVVAFVTLMLAGGPSCLKSGLIRSHPQKSPSNPRRGAPCP